MHSHKNNLSRLLFRRGRSITLILLALVLAGGLVPATMAAPARQTNVLRIGCLDTADSDLANGAQLAIDQINSSGGVKASDGTTYQLQLLTLAAPPTADSLPNDVSALKAQNVVTLLGPVSNVVLTPDNIQLLVTGGVPVLTGATSDTLTDDDKSDTLFRIRAPQHVYSAALAAYLLDDLKLSSIALVQTDVDSTEALLDFDDALSARGVKAADKVQLADVNGLMGQAQTLIASNPEAVVMWGQYQDAQLLIKLLRKGGWQGRFVYQNADEAARASVLSHEYSGGVIGVSSWSYAYTGKAARIFLRDYMLSFSEIPGPLAAASYDAIWLLRSAIIAAGVDPAAIKTKLIASDPMNLVAGTLSPAEFKNGDLIHMAMVYELGAGGGPKVVALFNDTQRLQIEDAGNQ